MKTKNFRILYHLTPQINKNKIFKIGLVPKSKNRKTSHPDRIYLFNDVNDYDNIVTNLKCNDLYNIGEERIYMLLKIELSNDIVIHTDLYCDNGFFIYDNIHPKYIEIIKKDL